MIQKTLIYKHIDDARIAHNRWVRRAEDLVNELPIDKDFIPLESTTCAFGKWLYGSMGISMSLEPEYKELLSSIENKHDKLHNIYKDIYNYFFVAPEHKDLFHKIITFNSKTISNKDMKLAQSKLLELKEVSTDMISYLDKLEKRVKQL